MLLEHHLFTVALFLPADDAEDKDTEVPGGEPVKKNPPKKERSVLQGKLTKMAVLIGKAGTKTV